MFLEEKCRIGNMKTGARKIVLDSWGGGIFFDRWMVIHFLAGFLIAYIALRFLALPKSVAASGTFGLLIVWEVVERLRNIYEPYPNIAIDVFVGMLGFVVVLHLPRLDPPADWVIVIFLVAVLASLNYFGWHAWKERGGNEADIHGITRSEASLDKDL